MVSQKFLPIGIVYVTCKRPVMLKYVFLIFTVTSLFGEVQKCVQIFDENNVSLTNITINFFANKEPNASSLGGLVTQYQRFYTCKIPYAQEKNKLCFGNHVFEDKYFVYKKSRAWKFSHQDFEKYFNSFQEIPERIVLKSKQTSKYMTGKNISYELLHD